MSKSGGDVWGMLGSKVRRGREGRSVREEGESHRELQEDLKQKRRL